MKGIVSTPYHSLRHGRLADGCKLCVKGRKLVLFVTGLCSARCDFCPVSDRKLYKDVVYANERPLKSHSELKAIIEEAKACAATGAGITGGDPLMVIDRTVKYIRVLKKELGSEFHIHLYTPLNLVNLERLKKLNWAGLDEIRFHADINKPEQWERMLPALSFTWTVGVEIPVMPGKEKETKRLIDFIAGKVNFLNLNELEIADNEVWRKRHFETKDGISYAVKGSEVLAKKLIRYAADKKINTHYCTCKLKDSVQLANRVKLRAKTVAHPFDRVSREGMLTRGVVYLAELRPGFGYNNKVLALSSAEKQKVLKKLASVKRLIGLPAKDIVLDRNKLRLIVDPRKIRKAAKGSAWRRAIVTEYPTFDSLELEVQMLD